MSQEDHYAEVSVYGFDDPKTRLDVLPNVVSPQFLEQINATGQGRITLSLQDPKLADLPTLLDPRNIFKLSCDGVVRSAFQATNREDALISSGEDSGKAVALSGNGIKQWLNDARVDPEGGLKQSSPDARVFSWASARGSWYKAADWKQPVRIEQYHMLPDKTNNLIYNYNPAEWPDAPTAWWVWSQAPTFETVNGKRLPVVPEGNAYFRYEFTVASGDEGSYSLFAAADDSYVAFIDSALAIDATTPVGATHFHETVRYDFELTAGPHVMAFRVTNRKRQGSNIRNPAALIAALFKAGDADSGVPARLITTTGSAFNWTVNGYPAKEPGWSVGEILLTLLSEATARGVKFPSWITPTFTATQDSNGVPWADNLPFSFNVGSTLLEVVQQMEELAVETWIDPDTYAFNVTQTRGTHKDVVTDTTDAVVLQEGWNLLTAAVDSEADLTNSLLMKTDDGWIVTQPTDSSSQTKYGKLESSISTSVNSSLSKKLSDKVFDQKAQAEVGATYTLIPRPGAEPFVDFNIGDWVLAPDAAGNMVDRRVASIAITVDDANTPLYAVEFDSIFETKEAEYDRMSKLLTGSGLGSGFVTGDGGGAGGTAPVTGSGTGYTPSNPVAPTNISVSSTGYFSPLGVALSKATFNWDPVSLDINGAPIKGVSKYEILGRRSTDAAYQSIGTVSGAETQMIVQGLPANETYFFVMRTYVSDARVSDLSDPPVSHLLAAPVTKMPAPTNPVLTSKLGTITATWDGRLSTGVRPAQFAYLYAEYAATQNATTWTQVGAIPGAGGIIITGQSVGSTVWVRFAAVDSIGRASDPSAAVSIVVAGVATGDLGQQFQDSLNTASQNASDALGKANTASDDAQKALRAAQDAAGAVGGVRVQATEPTGADRKASILWIKTPGNVPYTYNASNDTWVQSQDQALIDAAKAAADAKTLADSASKTAQTAAGQAGLALTSANGKNTIWYLPSQPTVSTSIQGDTWFDTDDGNKMFNYDGSSWVAKQYGTSAIADLAITNAKISNLDAAKITTGLLDAGRIASNSITSRMLFVGDFKDYLDGSDFENASTIPWTFPDNNAVIDTSVKHAGTQSIRLLTTGTYQAPPTSTVTTTEQNFSPNPKGSTGLTSWQNLNNSGRSIQTLSLSTADQYLGCSTAVRLFPGNGATTGVRLRHLVPVVGGVVSSLALGVRTSVSKSISLMVSFNDSTGAEEGTKTRYNSSAVTHSANVWRLRSMENLQIPDNATTLVLDIYSTVGAWASDTQYVMATGVMVNQGTAAASYFDGDTPSTTTDDGTTKVVNTYAWNGTAGNSPSTHTSATTTVGDAPVQPTREYASLYDVPVKPGQPLVLGAWVYSANQYNGSVNAFLELRDAATGKAFAHEQIDRAAIAQDGVWMQTSATGTVPAGVTRVRAYVRLDHTRGFLYLDDVTLKNGAGVLIEDGAVTAPMLRADSVTANAIQAGAVQTEQLDAYAITSKHTITGALIRTSESGARTEMNAAGLQVLGDDNKPLVQMGFGIATGMAIRDPNTSALVPLSNMAFGTKYFPAVDSAQSTSFAIPVGAENAWGNYSTENHGDWIAPSARVMWLFFALSDQASQQNYRAEAQAYLVDSTDTSVGARVRLSDAVPITWTAGFYMGVKTVVRGRTYSVRNSYRAYRTFSAPASPPAYVVARLNILMPV